MCGGGGISSPIQLNLGFVVAVKYLLLGAIIIWNISRFL